MHGREVVGEIDSFLAEAKGSGVPWDGATVLRPAIRRNIKLAEAPSFGQSIFDYAPWCPGAIDYRKLAQRFIASWERGAEGSTVETKSGPEKAEEPSRTIVDPPAKNPTTAEPRTSDADS